MESFAKVLEDQPYFSSRRHGQLTFRSIKPSQRGVTVGKRPPLSREEEESDEARLRGFVESCSAAERWRAAKLFRAALQHFRAVLEDQPAKRKTAYGCFCIMWRTPLQQELFWELQDHATSLSGSQCNDLISCRLGREWKALSDEQQQAYKPASECAKADPHIAGQVGIERPKKRQRVWQHSCKAGMGGEGARARLEVNIKQPRTTKVTIFKPRVIETASVRTTTPPGEKWNAHARKWERAV